MCYLYFFCLHCCLINIHIFNYPDSRLSGLFTEVPTSPDNRGSTVMVNLHYFFWFNDFGFSIHVALFQDMYICEIILLLRPFIHCNLLLHPITFVLIPFTILSNSFQKHMNELKTKFSLLHWQNPFYYFFTSG